jgi:hypothetical protein
MAEFQSESRYLQSMTVWKTVEEIRYERDLGKVEIELSRTDPIARVRPVLSRPHRY